MWSSQRKSRVNIGQVGRHQRRIIDSASVRRAYDDDQRPLGLAQMLFVWALASHSLGELYILFLKIKRRNQEEECWRARLLQPPQFKTGQRHAQPSYHSVANRTKRRIDQDGSGRVDALCDIYYYTAGVSSTRSGMPRLIIVNHSAEMIALA